MLVLIDVVEFFVWYDMMCILLLWIGLCSEFYEFVMCKGVLILLGVWLLIDELYVDGGGLLV